MARVLEFEQQPLPRAQPPAVPSTAKEKPKLRGVPDVVATAFAIPAALLLVSYAKPGLATFSAVVYGLCLVLLFGVSASYHTPKWTPGRLKIMRRLDHSSIYLLIAGSYTPICLFVLPRDQGIPLLFAAWGVAALGVLKTFAWPNAPRALNTIVYVGFGWMIAPFLSALRAALPLQTVALIGFGGLLYTVGAAIYVRRWPNPVPDVFGYHEVFHVFVVSAGACHYAAYWGVLT